MSSPPPQEIQNVWNPKVGGKEKSAAGEKFGGFDPQFWGEGRFDPQKWLKTADFGGQPTPTLVGGGTSSPPESDTLGGGGNLFSTPRF